MGGSNLAVAQAQWIITQAFKLQAPSPLGNLVRLTKQFKSGEQQHQVQLYQTHCSSKEKLYFDWKMRKSESNTQSFSKACH